MLRQVRWVGILLGIAATPPLSLGFNIFVSSVIDSRLYRANIAEGAGVTAREDAMYNTFSNASHLIAILLAPFLAGLLVGMLVAAFPGTNAAIGAAVSAVGIFAWFVGPLVPWIWEPISNPGEVYTRSENLGNLLEVSVIFFLVLPFIALAGYFGGKLGGRLRNWFITP
jgi:hypothetical protein